MATTGHESEAINVQGLKASLQKLKTDIIDGKIASTEKGAASGVATLDSAGKVPSSQLPSYVDDVVELLAISATAPEHCAKDDLYFNTTTSKVVKATATDTWGTSAATNTDPETGKIYVNLTEDKCYRWSGSAMIAVGSSDIEGIKVGSSGSLITPSQGVITIPAYETGADVTDAENVKAALSVVQQSDGKYLKDDGTWDTPPNTEYESKAAASGGTDVSLVTTGEKYAWGQKQDSIVFNTAYDATTNKAATMADIPASLPANGGNSATVNNHTVLSDVPANAVFTDTTYSAATQSDAGLMSAADKKKVDNVMALENSATTTGSLALTPNILYSLGTLTGALTVTLGSVVSGIPNTYMIEFDINDDAATPTKVPNFPASIVWREEPVWTTGKHYEISIRYSANTQAYYAMFVEFDTAS